MKFEEKVSEHKKALIPKYMMENIEKAPPTFCGRSKTYKVWYMNEYGHAVPNHCHWNDILNEWVDSNSGEVIGKKIMAMEVL